MKRTTRIPALITMALMAIATLPQIASAQSSDERAIRAAGANWQRWTKQQKTDSVTALFTPDAVFMLGNSPPVKGSAAIGTAWGEYAKTPALDLSWTPTRIDVTSPTRATEIGTYAESYDTPNGKVTDAGTYVTIWHKVNGRWRVALDAPVSSQAQQPMTPAEGTEFVARNASSIVWADFAPPGFPPGAKMSVLSGDPSKAGQFAVRLSLPADYLVPLHWHPTGETVTILSGSVHFGMGNSLDMAKTEAYGVGDYVFIPARHAHFLHAPTPTVVQVTGNGPFQINLGAPK
jgi:uncharacterized protein (TIGR02246 family)